jgi:hypothetical protein
MRTSLAFESFTNSHHRLPAADKFSLTGIRDDHFVPADITLVFLSRRCCHFGSFFAASLADFNNLINSIAFQG